MRIARGAVMFTLHILYISIESTLIPLPIYHTHSLLSHDPQFQFSYLLQCRITTKQTPSYPRRIYCLDRVERGTDWLRSRAYCVSPVSIISLISCTYRHHTTFKIDSLRGFPDGEIGARNPTLSHHRLPTSKANGYHQTSRPRLLHHHLHHDLAKFATPPRRNVLQHDIGGHAQRTVLCLRHLRSPNSISARWIMLMSILKTRFVFLFRLQAVLRLCR
jgi:hypothetical protein